MQFITIHMLITEIGCVVSHLLESTLAVEQVGVEGGGGGLRGVAGNARTLYIFHR